MGSQHLRPGLSCARIPINRKFRLLVPSYNVFSHAYSLALRFAYGLAFACGSDLNLGLDSIIWPERVKPSQRNAARSRQGGRQKESEVGTDPSKHYYSSAPQNQKPDWKPESLPLCGRAARSMVPSACPEHAAERLPRATRLKTNCVR